MCEGGRRGRERGEREESARDGMGKGKVAIGDWFLLARFTAIKGDLFDWMIRAIDTAFPFPNEFGQGAQSRAFREVTSPW